MKLQFEKKKIKTYGLIETFMLVIWRSSKINVQLDPSLKDETQEKVIYFLVTIEIF